MNKQTYPFKKESRSGHAKVLLIPQLSVSYIVLLDQLLNYFKSLMLKKITSKYFKVS